MGKAEGRRALAEPKTEGRPLGPLPFLQVHACDAAQLLGAVLPHLQLEGFRPQCSGRLQSCVGA